MSHNFCAPQGKGSNRHCREFLLSKLYQKNFVVVVVDADWHLGVKFRIGKSNGSCHIFICKVSEIVVHQ